MAFDNPPWPQPPNGAQYISAAGNLAKQLSDMISGVGTAYQQGQEFQYQQRQRNLFQGDDNAAMLQDALQNRNYAPLVQKLAQSGGASSIGLISQLMQMQSQADASRDLEKLRQPGGGVNTGPMASNAAASPASLGAGGQGGQPQLSSAGMDSAGGESVQSLAAGIAGGRDIPDRAFQGVVMNAARMLGVDPNQPLSAAQEMRARRLLGGNISSGTGTGAEPMGNASTGGINAVSQPGLSGSDNQETPRSSIGGMSAISPPPTSGAGNFGPNASGTMAGAPRQPLRVTVTPDQQRAPFDQRFNDAYGGQATSRPTPIGDARQADALDEKARALYAFSARPMIAPAQAEAARKMADQFVGQAREIRTQLGTYNAPATNPEIQGELHRFEGASKAVGDQIGDYIKTMPASRSMLNDLAVIDDALKSAKGNLTTGPGAEAVLRVKQFLNNAGIPVKGMTEAEVMQKMNTQLASVAAREFSQRPSQLEFRIFQQNLPGIMNSPQGTQILTDVLRQLTQQKIALGRMAMDQNNWSRWGSVEAEFFNDPKNQIRLPFSGNAAGQTRGQTAPGRYQWSPDGGLRAMQ